MKLKFSFCLLLLSVVAIVRAQDRIVTVQNDTIHCRVISVSGGNVTYEQPAPGGGVAGYTLPAEQVSVYFRKDASAYSGKAAKRMPEQRWRFGLQGGLGYLLASTSDAEKELQNMGTSAATAKDYYDDLKWGYSAGTNVHYMFGESWGLGIQYSLFKTSVQKPLTFNIYDGLNYWCIDTEERMYVNFIAPSFYTQTWLNRSNTLKLSTSYAFGYAHYRNEMQYDRNSVMQLPSYLATGNSFGYNLDVSFEYFPLKWMSIAAYVGYFGSWFGKLKISDGNNTNTVKLEDIDLEKENVSRLDMSIGIRFYVK